MPQLTNREADHSAALIALGSNAAQHVDQSVKFLINAIRELRRIATGSLHISRFYQSPAYPAGSGPDYVNAALSMSSDLAPEALLEKLHGIEQAFGRVREIRWGQRTLDLDLICVNDRILPDEETLRSWIDLAPERQRIDAPRELILPHPRMQDRAFVLLPLLDIAPDWRHPLLGRSVREMAQDLPEAARKAVIPLAISDSDP